jgi:hypothetical protein
LPEPAQFVGELRELNARGGVPVSVDDRKNWIRLYAQRACVGVRPLGRGDVFSIEFIEPMKLVNHGRLARSGLRLRAPTWVYFPQLPLVGPGYVAPDREIRAAWRRLQATQAQTKLLARHGAFCDALDLVIEAARQIEAEREPDDRLMPYYEVLTAGQARRSSAGIYLFRMSRPSAAEGAMIHLRGAPDLRGRVTAADGELLTVTFEESIDRQRIPDQGYLVSVGNDVVPRVQANAAARLRAGSTLNPNLLSQLVDGRFAAYEAPDSEPVEELDVGQTEAFRRALTVPDLLCVLGPPGTGKTRTIVEITRTASARGERVLITSQTNTAVDNVIERLPASLTAIRVGNEGRMSVAVQHKTVAATAADLQQRILSKTEASAQRLAAFDGEPSRAGQWLRALDLALAAAASAEQSRREALADRRRAVDAINEQFGGAARQAEQVSESAGKDAAAAAEQVRQLTAQLRVWETRGGLLGFLHRWRAERCRVRLAAAMPRAVQAEATADEAIQVYEVLRVELLRRTESDPAVRQAAARAATAEAESAGQIRRAVPVAEELARLMSVVGQPPASAGDVVALGEFARWCHEWEPFLRERSNLLADWRERLARPSEQLHAELVRYADVIGATCIGVDVQRNGLADLDFDLAVVDEAGQIPLASTLVPLSRARRAVLVGDHHQLPPFVDDDVQHWLRRHHEHRTGTDPALVTDLLVRSAFERLLSKAPSGNQVLLDRQRRMPAVLAEFVSETFYGGRLTTATKPRPPSPIFRSPLAVIDTSALPPSERAERNRPRSETWQSAGRDNRAEARLVLELARWYTEDKRDWVVITPYRAQVQLIDLYLREALGADAIRGRIGTVDLFQGQERDIVMFSFTRSNSGGRVGFLSELRRLNVAITRARDQLILIGDRKTLTNAHDEGFRSLARRLFQYADQHGDVIASPRLRDRLPR